MGLFQNGRSRFLMPLQPPSHSHFKSVLINSPWVFIQVYNLTKCLSASDMNRMENENLRENPNILSMGGLQWAEMHQIWDGSTSCNPQQYTHTLTADPWPPSFPLRRKRVKTFLFGHSLINNALFKVYLAFVL